MARPPKFSLSYFPLDVDISSDYKILIAQDLVDPDRTEPLLRYLVKNTAIDILTEIYREGYFMEWNENVARACSNKIGGPITTKILLILINSLIQSGFFNKDIYTHHNILTSAGIQKRWIAVQKQCNRKNISIPDNICLLKKDKEFIAEVPEFPPQETPENDQITSNLPQGSTQNNISFSFVGNNSLGNEGFKENITDKNNNNKKSSKIADVRGFPPQETKGHRQENNGDGQENHRFSEFLPQETIEDGQETNDEYFISKKPYMGNWNFSTQPEYAKKYYFLNPYFDRTRQMALEMLYKATNVDDQMLLLERLEELADEFVQKLVIKAKPVSMVGTGGFPEFFFNWLKKKLIPPKKKANREDKYKQPQCEGGNL
jgi:hypothetical protein